MLPGLESTELIQLGNWQLSYQPNFLSADQADQLMQALLQRSDWTQPEVRMGGRVCPVPRLIAWDGDPGGYYGYSGLVHETRGWQPELAELRDKIDRNTGNHFNFALLNLYRNGQDAMGWHSDNEVELGSNPLVASVSLGAERDFLLRASKGSKAYSIPLASGSLLLMPGRIQHHLPRRSREARPRINISFRQLRPNTNQSVNH